MSCAPEVRDVVPVLRIRPSKGWVSLDCAICGSTGNCLLPLLARHQGALQTDRPGRRLGDPPASSDHGGFQRFLRRFGEGALRRVAVPDLHLYGASSLAALRLCYEPKREQSGRQRQLITKVYFPRLVIPISAVLAGLVDFAIAFVVLLGMMAYYGISPTWTSGPPLLYPLRDHHRPGGRPVAVCPECAISRRALYYPVPESFWMFASPVAYPSQPGAGAWRALYGLNPWPAWSRASGGRCWARSRGRLRVLAVESAVVLVAAGGRAGLFPEHGKNLCGCSVMNDIAIRVEGLASSTISAWAAAPGHPAGELTDGVQRARSGCGRRPVRERTTSGP